VFTVAPNPANGTSVFRFTLAGAEAGGQIEIYSPAGACVWRLEVTTGQTAVVWDGRDAHGQRVEPGLYLIKCGTSFQKSVFVR
jgi:flagellar hook assembly protein FlgD